MNSFLDSKIIKTYGEKTARSVAILKTFYDGETAEVNISFLPHKKNEGDYTLYIFCNEEIIYTKNVSTNFACVEYSFKVKNDFDGVDVVILYNDNPFASVITKKFFSVKKAVEIIKNSTFFEEKKINFEKIVKYDDDAIAEENYYLLDNEKLEQRSDDEKIDNGENAPTKKAECDSQEEEKFESNAPKDEDELRSFTPYSKRVQTLVDGAFSRYRIEQNLTKSLPFSHFVVVDDDKNKPFVFGVVKENDEIKYFCYGVKGKYLEEGEKAVFSLSTFVPISPFELSGDGYYIIWQDAKTGAIIKKK